MVKNWERTPMTPARRASRSGGRSSAPRNRASPASTSVKGQSDENERKVGSAGRWRLPGERPDPAAAAARLAPELHLHHVYTYRKRTPAPRLQTKMHRSKGERTHMTDLVSLGHRSSAPQNSGYTLLFVSLQNCSDDFSHEGHILQRYVARPPCRKGTHEGVCNRNRQWSSPSQFQGFKTLDSRRHFAPTPRSSLRSSSVCRTQAVSLWGS